MFVTNRISRRARSAGACRRPLALALALMVSLPPLSWLGPGIQRSHGPFSALAQTPSCTPTRNQIIQDCTFLGGELFEQAAVQSYLTLHGRPASDASLIYQYGLTELRNEIRAYMFELILAYAQTDPSQLDGVQQSALTWLQAKLQAEDAQYWAAANAEYQTWSSGSNSSKCKYELDVDVAAAQGLAYDPTQYCGLNEGDFLSAPPVPTIDYFKAVAWKKTYASLLGASGGPALLNMQQQVSSYAALYALPASVLLAAAAGTTAAANLGAIFPFFGKQASVQIPQSNLVPAKDQTYATENDAPQVANNSTTVGQSSGEAELNANKALQGVDAEEALDTLEGVSGAEVFAVVVFAIETAVQAGMDAVNTQQTLDDLATLPGLASQAASNPPSLTALLSSIDGYTKASTVFTAATLPDFTNPIADPSLITPATSLYVVQQNTAGPWVSFLNSSSQHGSMAYRGGWFVSTDPVNGPTLVGGVDYIDWDGAARIATPVGPF